MLNFDYNKPASKYIVYPLGLLILLLGLFLLMVSVGGAISAFSQSPIERDIWVFTIAMAAITCCLGLGFTQFGWKCLTKYSSEKHKGILSPFSLYVFGIFWICTGLYIAVTSKDYVNPLGVALPGLGSIALARHRSKSVLNNG